MPPETFSINSTPAPASSPTRPPALFNYNDTWTPHWQARLDGQPVPVYRVNHLFKAVTLPAGTHRVDFLYDPPALRTALPISLAAGCLWLTLAAFSILPNSNRSSNRYPMRPETSIHPRSSAFIGGFTFSRLAEKVCSPLSRPAPRAVLALLILAASAVASFALYHRASALARRQGLIHFDPDAPRPCAPDRDRYLYGPPESP